MLDPLSALGLAAAVVQFVDFTAKTVSQADGFLRNDSSITNDNLQIVTTDLRDLSATFRERLRPRHPTLSVHIAPEEKALDNLFASCDGVAQELIQTLEKIVGKNKNKARPNQWGSVRAALRTVWHEDKIHSLTKQLEDYRQELTLRVLLFLNSQSESHALKLNSRLDNLGHTTQEIVEVVAISHNRIKNVIDHQSSSQAKIHVRERVDAERRHAETIAAILTLRDGTTETILKTPTSPGDRLETPGKHGQSALTLRMATKSDGIAGRSQSESKAQLGDFAPIGQKVLNCLYFRQINDRVEDVANAHHKTLEWIWDDTEAKSRWDKFVHWLEHGNGCYWINGKAGSGKSTLMKYIWNDPRFNKALLNWSGTQELVVVSFFFWALGSPMQKTQIGLLRSLLFDILQERPYLIPLTFPGLTRAATLETGVLTEPTFAELKKAFSLLLGQNISELRFCLLVDGLDEYEGDHSEVSEFFMSLSKSPYVKIIASSRPIPDCVAVFSICPKLRLQDLTYEDIKYYVEEALGKNQHMKRLEARDGKNAQKLKEDIINKASGVFLWVYLSVKSLLTGLRNYDSIEDLQRRLEILPADLENLYQHMLGQMSPVYRQQASCILQLVLQSLDVQDTHPMEALQLYFAVMCDQAVMSRLPVLPLSDTDRVDHEDEIEGRLRSRCCGLVEIYKRQVLGSSRNGKTMRTVGFLHRTVADFLRRDTVWQYVTSFVDGLEFQPRIALSFSCMAMLKIQDPDADAFALHGSLATFARFSITHLELSSGLSLNTARQLIAELESVLTRHWSNPQRSRLRSSPNRYWAIGVFAPRFVALCFHDIANETQIGSTLLTAYSGIPMDIKKQLLGNFRFLSEVTTPLTAQILFQRFYWIGCLMDFEEVSPSKTFAAIAHIEHLSTSVTILLDKGIDPKRMLELWEGKAAQSHWHEFIGLKADSGLLALCGQRYSTTGIGCTLWQFFLAYTGALRPARPTGSKSVVQRYENFMSAVVESTLAVFEAFLNSGSSIDPEWPYDTILASQKKNSLPNALQILEEFRSHTTGHYRATDKSDFDASYTRIMAKMEAPGTRRSSEKRNIVSKPLLDTVQNSSLESFTKTGRDLDSQASTLPVHSRQTSSSTLVTSPEPQTDIYKDSSKKKTVRDRARRLGQVLLPNRP